MKYECDQCSGMRCVLINDENELPMFCPFSTGIVHWEEVD